MKKPINERMAKLPLSILHEVSTGKLALTAAEHQYAASREYAYRLQLTCKCEESGHFHPRDLSHRDEQGKLVDNKACTRRAEIQADVDRGKAGSYSGARVVQVWMCTECADHTWKNDRMPRRARPDAAHEIS